MKETFILSKLFDKALNKEAFYKAKAAYCKTILENDFSIVQSKNLVNLIKTIKRSPDIIGPYKDLTPFEVLNRIGSDLVLLAGAEKLFNNEISSIDPETIKLNMGNKAGADISILTIEGELIYGEAFNAAASFCKAKMRQSINKIYDGFDGKEHSLSQSVVFYNSDVENILSTYKNKRELSQPDFIIHKIACDYEQVVEYKSK